MICRSFLLCILSLHYSIIGGVTPTPTTTIIEEYTDKYTETLKVKSLPSGNIYTYLEFMINAGPLTNHTRFFPRALSEILVQHSVQELHFSLTQGHWMIETWGEPILPASGGAHVIAWFTAGDNQKAGDNWKGLTSRLSGLTCASLNFLDDRNSIAPHFGYRPLGTKASFDTTNPLFVRAGSLPKENVCTENLTPWTKLLPCGVFRGLASLVRSKQVFNTHYHSAGIQFTKTESGVQLKLTLSLVFDSPQVKVRQTDNFVRRTFGSVCVFPCQPSSKTTLQLWKDDVWTDVDHKSLNSLKLSDIQSGQATDLSLIFTPVKYLGGFGQEYGEIIVEMTNHLSDVHLPVLYVEVLPWYIRPYLHTMKTEIKPASLEMLSEPGRLFHYTPGRDREVLHKLEMDFSLPPKSTVRVSFTVEKRHLRWDEYPPDANHGFYLESSHFEVNYTEITNSPPKTLYYYSRKLLVNLSTPDFSMPYNVICLTCTVVALAFGPLHNITTKSLKLTPTPAKKERLLKICSTMKLVWNKLLRRKAVSVVMDGVDKVQVGQDSADTSTSEASVQSPPEVVTERSSPSPEASSKKNGTSTGSSVSKKRKAARID